MICSWFARTCDSLASCPLFQPAYMVSVAAKWCKTRSSSPLIPPFLPPPPSVSGGPAQLSVGGAGRQQLPLPQPLRQLTALLLLAHRRVGRAQVRLPQEAPVSDSWAGAASVDQTMFAVISALKKKRFLMFSQQPCVQYDDSLLLCVLPVMFFWSWLNLRGTTSGILDPWWRYFVVSR